MFINSISIPQSYPLTIPRHERIKNDESIGARIPDHAKHGADPDKLLEFSVGEFRCVRYHSDRRSPIFFEIYIEITP